MVKLTMFSTFQCISSLSCKGRDDKKEEGREHLSPGQQYSEQLAKFKSLIDEINLISYQFWKNFIIERCYIVPCTFWTIFIICQCQAIPLAIDLWTDVEMESEGYWILSTLVKNSTLRKHQKEPLGQSSKRYHFAQDAFHIPIFGYSLNGTTLVRKLSLTLSQLCFRLSSIFSKS